MAVCRGRVRGQEEEKGGKAIGKKRVKYKEEGKEGARIGSSGQSGRGARGGAAT